MAGAGIKVFEAGQKLTANQVNTYLMDQAIAVFADATARDAAFGGVGEPNLSQGRVCYLKSDDKVYVYTATGWTEIGAQVETDEITTTKIIDGAVTSAKIASGTIVNSNVSASAAIALSKLATGTQGTVVIHNSSGVPTATALSGDVTVTNAGVTAIGSGKVTSDMILDGTIVNADINASAAIALTKLATGTQGTVVIHNSSGVPTATALSGDITVTNAGVTAIGSGKVTSAMILDGTIVNGDISSSASIAYSKLNLTSSIVNSDISSSASIAHSKLANATAGQVLLGTTTSGVITATTLSGDVTITGAGVTAIGTGKITSDMIFDGTIVNGDISSSAAIAYSKLNLGSSIVNSDISSSAAIAYSKLNLATSIVNGDISTSAAIAYSKLNLSSSIVNADVSSSAAIAYSKLNLTTSIVNGDISTTASIAYSKLNLSGSIVNADISSSAAIADSKLATISTAGKVSNSATTATSSNTASAIVARDASGNFTAGKATLSTADIVTVIETASVSSASATGTINIDFSTNPTVYYTGNATANWTLNVRGTSGATLDSVLSTGQIATVTFMATNGATPYRPTVFQIDGSAVTPKWMGGTAPSAGNASSIDIYTLVVIKTGSATFTVLASQSRFA